MNSLSTIPLTKDKQFFVASMKEAQKKGVAYQDLEAGIYSGRTIFLNGKELLNFSNCSYLGLDIHPKIKAGIIKANEVYGALLSNSRSYFSSPLYTELEGYLEQIFPGHPVVTTTTTLGHCSALPIMIEPEDAIIIDQFAHNSLRMASRLCKANGTKVVGTHHNNIAHFEKIISKLMKESVRNIWFLGDGIYSMQGDFINIQGIIELLDQYEQLHAYIDDAHGMSWTGKNGSGFVMGNYGVHPKMIVAVSMCKSFGSFGGIIVFPNAEWAERVRYMGQSLIFSAPIPPPLLGASIESAKIHLSGEIVELQNDLMQKIRYLRKKCSQAGIEIKTKDETPIQFIEIGENSSIYRFNKALIDSGIFVTAAGFPAMPRKHGGIRISLTCHITYEDIDTLVEKLIAANIDKYRIVKRTTLKSTE